MARRHDRRVGFGRHALNRPGAIQVAALLEAAIQQGQAIRLAWPSAHADATPNEFPTAILSAIPAAVPPDGEAHE